MLIGVIGINHKLAELSLREKIVRGCEKRFSSGWSQHENLSYVILLTCNRAEIYFCSNDLSEAHSYLLNILKKEVQEEFAHKIYSYFHLDCFLHLAKVTSGIDSAILLETEIQGQVKQAYESATKTTSLPFELHYLFQKSLKIGKQVRTLFPTGRSLPSLEETILETSKHFISKVIKPRILFVGLSEINRKIMQHFEDKGLNNYHVCNRTPQSSISQFIAWENLDQWEQFDVIIVGTRAPQFILSRKQLSSAPASKKLILDLSVPRNVDPLLSRLSNITLLNLDQINRLINRKKKRKGEQLALIETEIVSKAVKRHTASFHQSQLRRLGYLSIVG